MYYQRRKCSDNVYFLERSRERSSEPVLKELPLDTLRVWNTSIERLPEEKISTSSSIATLRISAATGYDWRRDRNLSSCQELPSPRGLQLIRRNNLKLQPGSQENCENECPPACLPGPIPAGVELHTPQSKISKLEEENSKLKESLAAALEECKALRADLSKADRRDKELQEQLKQRNRRIDELERDKWLANYKISELEKKSQAAEDMHLGRVDPNQLLEMMRKIETLETLQRQMEREIRTDEEDWKRELQYYEESNRKLRA